MVCPNCGKLISADEKICKLCGLPTKQSSDIQPVLRKASDAENDDTTLYYMPESATYRESLERRRLSYEKEEAKRKKRRC